MTNQHNRCFFCIFPSTCRVMKLAQAPSLPVIEEESEIHPLDLEEPEKGVFVAILLLSLLEISGLHEKSS